MAYANDQSSEASQAIDTEGMVSYLRLSTETLQAAFIVLDLVIIAAVASFSDRLFTGRGEWFGDFFQSSSLAGALFVATLLVRGGYRINALPSVRTQLIHVQIGWLVAFFVLAWAAFLLKVSSSFSRATVSMFFVMGGIALAATHGLAARWLFRQLAAGRLSLHRAVVIVCGDGSEVERVHKKLRLRGIEIVGTHALQVSALQSHASYRGALGTVRRALETRQCDHLLIFAPWHAQRGIEELRSFLAPLPVPIYLMVDDAIGKIVSRPDVTFGSLRGFELQRAPLGRLDRALKRGLDIMVASVALVVLAPVMCLTAAAIWMETGRPILFRQHRKGFGGRKFEILKFRTMTVQENGDTVTQASRNDPRVTRLGATLRKTSIDELPQLFNVLKGDMSIVGPRPHALAHDDVYDEVISTYAFRQHVKPGITGWAQVNGLRGETREVSMMAARVEYDLSYINNWSIWLDMKIIMLTAVKVLNDKTAY